MGAPRCKIQNSVIERRALADCRLNQKPRDALIAPTWLYWNANMIHGQGLPNYQHNLNIRSDTIQSWGHGVKLNPPRGKTRGLRSTGEAGIFTVRLLSF